jgi:hypothetical protein
MLATTFVRLDATKTVSVVGAGVEVGAGVAVGDGEAVGDAVGVDVGVAVGAAVSVAVGDSDAVGAGVDVVELLVNDALPAKKLSAEAHAITTIKITARYVVFIFIFSM